MLAHVIVSGRVQGVGFRYTAQQHANQYNLNGWVQNKSDGTVELELEGDDSQVHTFLSELEKGFSPFIHVRDMQVDTQREEKGYSDFSIR
ncbi:acylphosphatase [Lentibacillus halodurans]|uniref:Acylphosphatase n=1 Tax=Lentibacillus halodurans TaxID=237679 RepID=A0A1I0VG12_9BACI|nr:acylphosphatase [Lentibacillus halodurans]SFA74910.1 acylphosphatase [Lentibacillus halodurans]